MSQVSTAHGQASQVERVAGWVGEHEAYEHMTYFREDLGIEALIAEFGGRRSRRSIDKALKSVANNALRSVVAPFATLLLLRWMEHFEADRKSATASKNAGHRPILTPDRHWTAWCRLEGKDLCRFFHRQLVPALESAPNVAWAPALRPLTTVLRSCQTVPPAYWSRLISWVELYDLSGSRGRADAGQALQWLTEDTTDTDRFATTSHLAYLMVALLDPKPGGRIYDPCFGTGGLLVRAMRAARSGGKGAAGAEQQPTPTGGVLGVEIDPYAYIVGTAQVALAGASNLGLELRDALDGFPVANSTFEGADYITAHPPWGLKRPDAADRWPVPTPELAMLLLQHAMKSLNPGGRAVVALPDSALYRLGHDRDIRRILLTEYLVEGVVAIPDRSLPLLSYAPTDVSVLVFSRSKPASTVRFLSVPDDLRGHVGQGGLAEELPGSRIAAKFRSGKPDSYLWDTPLVAIKKRDWDLCAKRTGSAALERKLARLSGTDNMIETKPLGSVADVATGTPSKADADSRTVGEIVVRILRVADITDSGVRRLESGIWQLGKAPQDTRPEREASYPLCPGDVLLTITGSIGRVGVLDRLEVASVAGYGVAAIRPSDALSPAFLKYVLASDAYQKWLRGHSRGPIQRLSVGKLLELPVPVPPMESQERVVSRLSGDRGDPLAAIIRVLSDTHDPVVKWLEESEEIRQLDDLNGIPDVPVLLDGIAGSMQRLSSEIASADAPTTPELVRWLGDVVGPVAALNGIADIPPGPERLAILDGLSLQLERLAKPGDGPSWEVASAYKVTRRIVELANLERERILAEVAVEADIEPSWVAAGAGTEVQLGLTNRSLLPLRRFEASTIPNVGGEDTAYLAAGAKLNVPIRIPSDAPIGFYRFKVHWGCALLNGSQTKGRIPLAVDVRASPPAGRVREIGSSPYIVGNPIDRKEMLFGREAAIEEICRQLRSDSQANVVLLEGNRRTGKTSILKRLQDPEVLPDWITVNCSLQGGEGHASKAGLPTNAVFRLMARDIGRAAHAAGVRVWLPDVDAPDPRKPFRVAFVKALRRAFSGDPPFETFELFLQTVIEAARPRRILLMLDEFDKLQEGIDAEVTSPQVPENIRYLLHTYPEFSAILAGSRRIKRLREEYWSALFGFGHRVPVSGLQLEDARLLVTQPVDGRLVYVPEARDLVVGLCARQPFLIQSLCNRIFESAARSKRRTITVDDVNTAAEAMTEDNEHFRTMWGYAGTERRRFLLALCRDLGDRAPITLDLLERSLRRHGVHLRRGERLGDDLEFLRELELIELRGTSGGSAYRLAIPLMAAWIGRNEDFEDQRRKAVEEFEEADQGEGYWIATEEEE